MSKISLPASNDFCPQCLFLYGTYKENGDPNYGLFCWATYCSDDGFKFVACIGQDKLTRDRIRSTGVFSASIVSESLLPAADFCGNNEGYSVDKSSRIESVRGAVLNVPVPKNSPWSFELEVDKTLHLDDNNTSEITITDNIEFNLKNIVLTQEKDDTYSATILNDDIIQFKENINYGVYVNGDPCYQVNYATNYIRAEYGYTFMDDNLESKLTDTLQFNFAFFDKGSNLKITTNGGQEAVNYWNNYFARNNFVVEVKQSNYDKNDDLTFGEGDTSEFKLAKFIIKGEEYNKRIVKIGEKITPPAWSGATEYVAYWTLNGERVNFNEFVVTENCVFEAVLVPIEQHTINLIFSSDEDPQNLVYAGRIRVEEDELYITEDGNNSSNVLVTCQNGLNFDVELNVAPEFIMANDYEIIVISEDENFQNCITRNYFNDMTPVNLTSGYAYNASLSFTNISSSATVIVKVTPREFNLSIKLNKNEIINISGLVYGKQLNLLEKLSDEQIKLVKNSVGSGKEFKGLYTSEMQQGSQYYDENLNCLSNWAEKMYRYTGEGYVDNPLYDKDANTFSLYIGYIYK